MLVNVNRSRPMRAGFAEAYDTRLSMVNSSGRPINSVALKICVFAARASGPAENAVER